MCAKRKETSVTMEIKKNDNNKNNNNNDNYNLRKKICKVCDWRSINFSGVS